MKRDTKILIGAIIFFVAVCVFCIVMVNLPSDNSKEKETQYYFGETMQCDEIDFTVSKIATIEDIQANSDLKRTMFLFTLKNNKTESFSFQYSDFYLTTEDKGEKYNYVSFDTSLGEIIKNEFVGETLLPGETKNFYLMFDTPYMANEKKFILHLQWDSSSNEKKYFLYNRDGSFPPNEAADEDFSNPDDYTEELKNLRDDIYDIFEKNVYEKIDGTLYYTDIEKLMDSVRKQCKEATSSLEMRKDLSNGVYYPKWIISVTTNDSKKHDLFYIEIELSSSFVAERKRMAKYQIE